MSAVSVPHVSLRILRWDQASSEFWEAVIRIGAELGYASECSVAESHQHGRADVVSMLPQDVRDRLLTLVSQLPWLLPALERALIHSYSRREGQKRIDYYCDIFSQACRSIDLRVFVIDDDANEEERWRQTDALSRAMLLKSDLLLIHAQFELLRQQLRKAQQRRSRFNVVA